MSGTNGANGSSRQSRNTAARWCGVTVGGAVSAFVAAAAMATGSAAPAKADIVDLIDPIVQPALTSLTDSLATVDPTLAVDLSSWTDSLLSSLGSLDVSAAAASTSDAVAAASSAEPAAATGTYDIPITIAEGTEPTVQSTVDGVSTTELVDTGSSGLVVPLTHLASGYPELINLLGLAEPLKLLSLGLPSGIGVSGYSGGVDYLYLTYDAPVDYTASTGVVDTTVPIEVEVYSWNPGDLWSLFTNDAFQHFVHDDDVTGILGIGDNVSGGAGESPIEAAGFTGVTVDLPDNELILSNTNPFSDVIASLASSGSTVDSLTETLTTSGGTTVGSATVSDDVDSGGVFGTIPSAIGSAADGDTISVYDGSTLLYSYVVGDSAATGAPTVVSGTDIDSGAGAFLDDDAVYINYSADTLTFDQL